MPDVEEVEKRTDLIKARSVEIGTTIGGLKIMTGDDLEKMAARIARGGIAVPVHCRDQPGVVHALFLQAIEWGLPIMSVINKSYVPRGGDRIGFESQLLHAVIEKNARLKKRMRFEIVGEGDQRRCKVWATFEGEEEPHTYLSQTLAEMHPGHVTKEVNGEKVSYTKGSPLWDDNPEVQMFYSASRQWARLFCPDVLLGAYTPEELQREPRDVTPVMSEAEKFAQRLKDKNLEHVRGRGFDADGIRATIIEGDTNPGVTAEVYDEVTEGSHSRSGDEGRGHGDDRGGDDQDAERREPADGGDQGGGAQPVGNNAASEGDQASIFPPDRKPVAKPKGRKR